MRVVLDTNVWLSALFYSGESSPLREIVSQFLNGGFEIVSSPTLVDEFIETCERYHLEKSTMAKYVKVIRQTQLEEPPLVSFVEPKSQLEIVSADPDDNRVIECAVEGNAEYIVTGDKHLLRLGSYQQIRVISPREFFARLNEKKSNVESRGDV